MIEFIRGWLLLYISTRINISILIDFLSKLMLLPISYFDSKHTGDILQRLNDHRRIEAFLTDSSINTLFSIIHLCVFSIVLLVYNSPIFAVFALASIFYSTWILIFLRKRRQID